MHTFSKLLDTLNAAPAAQSRAGVMVRYKLGEDVARPGEILVTDRLREALGDGNTVRLKPIDFSVSGVEVLAYTVENI